MGDRSKRTYPALEGYRFQRVLGRGGMGEVWLATDVTLGRQVAVKLIRQELADDPDFSDRFFNEMKTVAKFRHPNIGRVYGTGRTSDGRLAMIMELLDGESLRQMLDSRPPHEPFDIVRAAYYTIQALEAIQEAHEQGIQHRDIKPENVIIHEDGHVWLVDFGVATRWQITGEIGKKKTEAPHQSTLFGTARYMAPELIEHGRSDHRSDLYSVGVMLYHMLTADFPHPGIDEKNETGILAAHVHLEPTPISELREDCEGPMQAILNKLLAKDPDRRYQSAEETITDLSMLVRGSLPPDDPIAKRLVQDREQKARKAAYVKHVARADASRHTQSSVSSDDGASADASSIADRAARAPQSTKPLPRDFVARSPSAHSTVAQESRIQERSTVPMSAPGATSVSSPYFTDNQSAVGSGRAASQASKAAGPAAPVATPPTPAATPPKPLSVPVVVPRADVRSPALVVAAPTGPLPSVRARATLPRPSVPSTSSTNPGWERERARAGRERGATARSPHVRQLLGAVSIGVALAVSAAVVMLRGRAPATTADAGLLGASNAPSGKPELDAPAPPPPTLDSSASGPASASDAAAPADAPAPAPDANATAPTIAQADAAPSVKPRGAAPNAAPRGAAPSAAPRGQPRTKPTSPAAAQPVVPEPQKKPEPPAAPTARNRVFGAEE